MSLLYAPVAMTVMVAVCLLAIDYGRAQLIKSELQQAADAAAMAGVRDLRLGSQQVRTRALAAASYNRTEGRSVALASDDVRIGKWDEAAGSFEPTSVSPNAVEVVIQRTEEQGNPVGLMFGGLFEQYSADVSVVAVARLTEGSTTPSFVGLESVEAKNNTLLTFDSTQGPASGANLQGSAMLGSNGTITFNKPPQGDAAVIVLGPDGSYSSGSAKYLDTELSYPPTETPTVPSKGVLNVTQSMVLPAGTHYYTSIVFSNNTDLSFAGPATLYVRDNIVFAQGNTITAANGIPSNLKIRIIGGASSYVGGANANNVDITAEVYAPDSDLTSKNNAYIRGSGIFRSMYAKNNLELYADRAFVKPTIGLVR